MQVEIWSDVACPWCYVGTRRFERAVEETGIDVDVVYRSFELDPNVPPGAGPPLTEYLARKFGDLSRVQAAHARLTVGRRRARHRLPLVADAPRQHLRRPPPARVGAAHLRAPTAQRALKRALLRAYFTDGREVADHDVLADLAGEVGLDRAAAPAFLATDDEADFVRAERDEAYSNGINAVPTFIVEGQWMLQGALETDKWVKALTHIQAELARRGRDLSGVVQGAGR